GPSLTNGVVARMERSGMRGGLPDFRPLRGRPSGLRCFFLRKPIENLTAVPSDDAILRQDVFVSSLHVRDAMGRTRKIIVVRHGHDLGAIGGFSMDTVKIFCGTRERLFR